MSVGSFCLRHFRHASRQLGFTRSYATQSRKKRNVGMYLIPLVGGGGALVGYEYFKGRQEGCTLEQNILITNLKVDILRLLPLNIASRLWGKINDVDLPVSLRSPLLGLYVRTFNCNLDEAENPNLQDYKNLGQFFRRSLKPGCRPVDKVHPLVSPSDGLILNCGVVTKDQVEQIKGVTYSLSRFLGPQPFSKSTSACETLQNPAVKQTCPSGDDVCYEDSLKRCKNSTLYHCVIYLAPGDYHRFHSPANWEISHRRYFPGYLFSVRPSVAGHIPQLFNLNERVVYFGNWQSGFFSMALVGAANVGSIRIYSDKDLLTNVSGDCNYCHDHDMQKTNSQALTFSKGGPFGEFNLGSTIVLVFEAAEDFKFSVAPGQKIKYGEPLGR